MARMHDPWGQTIQVQISVILYPNCVTWGNLFYFFVPQCPHLWDRDNNDSYFIVLLWEFNGLINFKWDKKCLAFGWHSTNISYIIIVIIITYSR